jgi:hypothetical protein
MTTTETTQVNPVPKKPTGRGADGTFQKGCAGGPGNPFGRRIAELRRVVLGGVSEETMRRVTDVLIEKAVSGETAAIRLFFQYTLGKPQEAVNPDRVDIDEWELTKQTMVPTDVANEILYNSTPISIGCVAVPNVAQIREEQLFDMMDHPEKYPDPDDADESTEEELQAELERQREFMKIPGAYEGTATKPGVADDAEKSMKARTRSKPRNRRRSRGSSPRGRRRGLRRRCPSLKRRRSRQHQTGLTARRRARQTAWQAAVRETAPRRGIRARVSRGNAAK